ncbi:MAG: SH3 domain-containing protein [bacterium]
MTTDIEHEESVEEMQATVAEPPAAVEELLEFTRERVQGDMTRCPACNLFVPISARRCQHCESNIEANNALVRETLRRIDDTAHRLDDEGRALHRAWRSAKNRIKRLFGRKSTIEGIVPGNDAQRDTVDVQAGDQITVAETHGAWALVQTADGRHGWVYWVSTE